MSLELEREQVVQHLCTAYANDQLTTGELESRLERVYATNDRRQLLTLLDGIAAAPRPVAMPYTAPAPPPPRYSLPPGLPAGRALPADERRVLAVLSEVKKEGAWTPTRVIRARALLGTVLLDFREASIPSDDVFLDVDAIMGEVKILLPPGVGARVDCSSILGEVSDKSRPALPGAPTIHVTGGVMMGTITVVTKVPKKEGAESWRGQLRQWLGAGD